MNENETLDKHLVDNKDIGEQLNAIGKKDERRGHGGNYSQEFTNCI